MPDVMVCECDVDVYVLKLSQERFAVDHALLLFAAACILIRGLSQTKAFDHGIMHVFWPKSETYWHTMRTQSCSRLSFRVLSGMDRYNRQYVCCKSTMSVSNDVKDLLFCRSGAASS
jgi:hypothetical protein